MPKREVHNFGPRENFVEVFAIGTETVVSPKGNPGLLIEVTEIDAAGNMHGVVTSKVGTGEKGFDIPFKGLPGAVAGLFRGPGREEEEEEPPLTAELLSLDPTDPRNMAQLLLDQSLATLSAQLAENPELLNQEGMFEQWMNLALVEQGMATDPQMAAAATTALGLNYQEAFAAGEFDTPEKAEEAAQMFAQQLQALTGFEEAVAEGDVSPEDELTALYEQQVKEQAEFEQMGFYREGIMAIVGLAPAEARLGLMAGMLQDPSIAKMFFPQATAPEKPEWVKPLEGLGQAGPQRPPSSAGVIGSPELD